jgi:outer membrane protein assembly factor BamB
MPARNKYVLLFMLPLIAITSLSFWWLIRDPTQQFELRQPDMDGRKNSGIVREKINIGEFFERFSDKTVSSTENWPRFRGIDFDNICKSEIKLIDRFGPSGPKIIWTKDLGEGHAGPAIYQGAVYVLDYDEEEKAEMLRCFELKTGNELWRRWYGLNLKRNHGMSRTIPAVDEKYILTLGPTSQVMCLDRVSGNLLWSLDLTTEYGTEIPFWYTGQCPLLDGEEAVLAPGGKALLIGVDAQSGEVIWETPNEMGWKMSHSSIMPFVFAGIKMYVYSAIGGVVGVRAEGTRKGEILWQTNEWKHQVVAPSPVCLPDGKIFLAAGYGAGSMVIQLNENNGTFSVDILTEYETKDGLSSEQQTPIYHDGYIFSVLPKDAGPLRNQFVCVDPQNFNQFVWSSGQADRFGLGPYILADDKFFILDDQAVLTIAQVSTNRYIPLDQYKLFDGHDSWGPFALADGLLILRDSKKMMCIDLRT